ncbi:response regulator [Falsiroseomonas sp. E2-1-a20]|uniref:response regulator n=1 Tax=Falsiroseomonas sp. E2-1-a20 TaxID=3239300 RepID=UPI003F415F76
MPSSGARTVLVVEDEDIIAMAAGEALQGSGFRVCGTADSEATALQLAAQHDPEFAVVDLHLGGVQSGLRIGRTLVARGVSVLYATGHGSTWRQEMEDTGARGCLTKPYEPAEVPAALMVLERLRAGETVRRLPPDMHLFVD